MQAGSRHSVELKFGLWKKQDKVSIAALEKISEDTTDSQEIKMWIIEQSINPFSLEAKWLGSNDHIGGYSIYTGYGLCAGDKFLCVSDHT